MKAHSIRSALTADAGEKRFARSKRLLLAVVVLIALPLSSPESAQAGGVLFDVDSTGDQPDASAGDGFCATAGGQCTLRAAIQEANADPGDDDIDFAIPTSDPGYDPATGSYTINLFTALPDINTNMEIIGPGANQLTVRRLSISGAKYRVFTVEAGTVVFSGMTISNGDVSDLDFLNARGGGIKISNGHVHVASCILTGNTANDGGAIWNDGHLDVSDSSISENVATSSGECHISQGGGITNYFYLVVRDSTITGNQADDGGGIRIGGNADTNISNSTVSFNVAQVSGGGVFNAGHYMTVVNSTVSFNSVLGVSICGGHAGEGGGFYNVGGQLIVNNSTLSSNSANEGGGIEGSASLRSNIIALNTAATAGPDVHGSVSSFGFNLVQNTAGSMGFPEATDITGVDPQLDPNGLQNNGGPTQTIALLAGSPAIDQGTSNDHTTDQRGLGYARTIDTTIADAADGTDMGAFEAALILPSASGSAIIEESCPDGRLDPGERVTVTLSLRNPGEDITNLVATLLPGGGVTNPTPASQSYGAVPGDGAPVSRDWIFTVDPARSCGSSVVAALSLQDGAKGIALGTITYTFAPLKSVFSYTGPAVAIPDNTPAGVNIPIPVSGVPGNIADLDFSIDNEPDFIGESGCTAAPGATTVGVDHTWVGNLVFKLTSPQGTTVTLMDRPGGPGNSGNNFCQTLLDDDDPRAPSINDITPTGSPPLGPPYSGIFTPQNPLSAFDGENPNGTWVLNVSDNAGSNTGNIRAFSLGIAHPCCTNLTPALNSVVSRKTHGSPSVGTFDVNLPLTSPVGIECRSGGATNDHTMVFIFGTTLTSVGGASVTSGTGNVSSSAIGADAHEYVVNLTGVANAQEITVTLTDVTDSLGNNSASVQSTMGVLLGDTSGNGTVNASDIGQSKAQSGQPVTVSNFRADVNPNGSINSSDISLVKSQSGTGLP